MKGNMNPNIQIFKKLVIKPDQCHQLNITEVQMEYISNLDQIIQMLKTNDKQTKLLQDLPEISVTTDLIPNKYEGGLALWECTLDLLAHLLSQDQNQMFKSKRIMDLGCGHGLLGIFALMRNGSEVVFQDYNTDVLQIATFPNILKNLYFTNCLNNCKQLNQANFKLMSGDWETIPSKLKQQDYDQLSLQTAIKIIQMDQNQTVDLSQAQQLDSLNYQNNKNQSNLTTEEIQFDIILSSEVLYNIENYKKLSQTICESLKKGGNCYIASKVYYFGVGGSVDQFKEFISCNYANSLQLETILQNNKQKIGNKRVILKLTKI